MRVKLLIVFTLLISIFSCQKETSFSDELNNSDLPTENAKAVLGKKLLNPYSVEVMKKACDILYPPTKGEAALSDSIQANYLYVRFQPADSAEYNALLERNYELYSYPLDYEILGDVSDYYDPTVPEGKLTWQYTAVPIDEELPSVKYEIIEECYIPPKTSSNSKLRQVEDKALDMVDLDTRFDNSQTGDNTGGFDPNDNLGGVGYYKPDLTGSIKYVSTTGDTLGVKGIKVRARVFMKIKSGYTDNQGFYSIENDFCDRPRFELRYENKKDFKIGYDLAALALPSTYDMKHEQSIVLDSSSESLKWWQMCVVNNAAYNWYEYCHKNGIASPPDDLRLWCLSAFYGGATLMFHRGVYNFLTVSRIIEFLTLVSREDSAIVGYQLLKIMIQFFGPDIVINGLSQNVSEVSIAEVTYHELAHASHFQVLGSNDFERSAWWSRVANYEIDSYIETKDAYGTKTKANNGPCAVTESWAGVMGLSMLMESPYYRYWSSYNGSPYWFCPYVLWKLIYQCSAVSVRSTFASLNPEVDSMEAFIESLVQNNQSNEAIIRSEYAVY